MRRLTVIVLPLCVLYFIVGIIFVWANVISQDKFLTGAGIVGAVASVIGLFSFLRPTLSTTDIQNIEAKSLQKLADVSAELKTLEEARSEASLAITDLEEQKKQMELLVRKASMSLFFKEQYSHHQQKISRPTQEQRGAGNKP